MGATHIPHSAAYPRDACSLQMWLPFKEKKRLSSGITFIAKKHCYNKEIIYQTISLFLAAMQLLTHFGVNFWREFVNNPKEHPMQCVASGVLPRSPNAT